MAFRVPRLQRVCVVKIVEEIRHFCCGLPFDDLGKFLHIIGPFEYLSSQCVESIFDYVVSTRQLSQSWLSLLVVSHLRTIDFCSFPSGINTTLFKMLIRRCKCLVHLLIPNCKKVSNNLLCDLLSKNPSLLRLDISNKLSPKVDSAVIDSIARSCRSLRVLKLSDYRVEEPSTLLLLCGRRVCCKAQAPATSGTGNVDYSIRSTTVTVIVEPTDQPQCGMNAACNCDVTEACSGVLSLVHNMSVDSPSKRNSNSLNLAVDNGVFKEDKESASPEEESEMAGGGEEERNMRAMANDEVHQQSDAENDDGEDDVDDEDDLYENDNPITALEVEDHSSEFGCLELETLCLENVNLTDTVAAVLMQNLPKLRHLNVSDTDLCNPWRLLDQSQSAHLKLLQQLDVKSTALSRTALEMIPKYHPDLQKFSISSTTLPPHTYANIGRLTGVAELELIGGQFYLCEPAEIFEKGVAPAVQAIGQHLCSLNLAYFAHINLEVITLNCPNLEQLDLSFSCIRVVYPCHSLGVSCVHLSSLNLAYSHIEATETNFEDLRPVAEEKALQGIIGSPRVLEEVYLGGLAVNDDTIASMFSEKVHPLRILNISRCRMVTIEGVRHMWERCPYLQDIDLTHCKEITVSQFRDFQATCFRERPGFKLEGKIDWK